MANISTFAAWSHREPLFSVDYEDPDFDNLYFDDKHIGDGDDDEINIVNN